MVIFMTLWNMSVYFGLKYKLTLPEVQVEDVRVCFITL